MYQPLADLLRPTTLDEVYGQEHILVKNSCKKTGKAASICSDCGTAKHEALPISSEHTVGMWMQGNDKACQGTCSVCDIAMEQPHERTAAGECAHCHMQMPPSPTTEPNPSTPSVGDDSSSFLWPLLVVGILLIAGGCIALIFIRVKKAKGL